MKKYILIFLLLGVVCGILVSSTIISLPEEEWLQSGAINSGFNKVETKTDITTTILDEAYNENKDNTMFSPLSLDMAIGMVSNGTINNSAVFNDFLKNDNYSDFVKEYIQHVDSLNCNVDKPYLKYNTVFEITNSIWIDNKMTLNPDFEHRLSGYEIEAQFVDFNNKTDVVKNINDWCYKKTREMIKEVITEHNLNNQTKLIAVNTIYFESPWCEPWDIVMQPIDFTKIDGKKINPKFIQTETTMYFENKEATAFGVNYQNGLTFIGILPKANGDFTVSSLNIDDLLKSKTDRYDVNVTMPTFKFNNNVDNLKNTMCTLGYKDIFSTGILDSMVLRDNILQEMTVSDIIQMNAIELDENGTKAAAVTTIITDNATSAPDKKKIKNVILDRPFAFLIYDSKMEQIVFVGKVVNPI